LVHSLSLILNHFSTNQYFIFQACLAAVAVAEPDAKAEALLYGGYGYGLGLGYAGLGYGYAGLRHYGYGYGPHGLGNYRQEKYTSPRGFGNEISEVNYKECEEPKDSTSFHDFTTEDIEKLNNVSFSDPEYAGKVLLVVNLASF